MKFNIKSNPPPHTLLCKCCANQALLFDVCDFNKSPTKINLCGIPIYYYHCSFCGFVFTCAFDKWSNEEFSHFIYNQDYTYFDPDYLEVRPQSNAILLRDNLKMERNLDVLDYGCGNGKMLEILRQDGYKIEGYDAFSDKFKTKPTKKYDVIVAFEVVEHISDVFKTFQEIFEMLKEEGVFLFSTLLQPQNILDIGTHWWYITPRNGHISIFTQQSLRILCQRIHCDYEIYSFSEGLHLIFNKNYPPHYFLGIQ